MKTSVVAALSGAAAVLLVALGWIALPALQASQTKADAKASVQLERARRLLHQHNAGLQYKSLVLEQLRSVDVDVDFKEAEAVLEHAEEEFQNRVASQWDLYTPTEWGEEPRPARKQPAKPGEIPKALKDRKTLLDQNSKLLDQALAAINEALQIQEGSATANSHAESLRLKATILYFLGLNERLAATLKRVEADPVVRELVDIGTRSAALRPLRSLIADAGVDTQLELLKKKSAEIEQFLAQEQAKLAEVDIRIKGFESRLQQTNQRAAEARRAMEGLVATGIQSTDVAAADEFARKLVELDENYRKAVREAQAIQYGDYANARIDASGDLLGGEYVNAAGSGSPVFQYGLARARGERVILMQSVEIQQRSIDELRAENARLTGQKNAGQAVQDRAAQGLDDLAKRAQEAYVEWSGLESAVAAREEKAIKYFDQSSGAAKQSAAAIAQWISEAREPTQNLSETAKPRSAMFERLQNGWMTGFTAVQEADAQAAKALIYSTRFLAAEAALGPLRMLKENLELAELDLGQWESKAKDAQEAGIKAVNQATAVLEKGYRESGKHWTLVAQEAGTIYLLTFLGHPEFVSDSVEAYRAAVKGREGKSFADGIEARLRTLESRKP